jgi:hypothetical protein
VSSSLAAAARNLSQCRQPQVCRSICMLLMLWHRPSSHERSARCGIGWSDAWLTDACVYIRDDPCSTDCAYLYAVARILFEDCLFFQLDPHCCHVELCFVAVRHSRLPRSACTAAGSKAPGSREHCTCSMV